MLRVRAVALLIAAATCARSTFTNDAATEHQSTGHTDGLSAEKAAAEVSATGDTAHSAPKVSNGGFWGRYDKVWLHLGSHADPLLSGDKRTLTIAVEPDPSVAAMIPHHRRMRVLVAAVGNTSGVAELHKYNNGLSSSLGEAADHMLPWFDGPVDSSTIIVPVIPLVDIMRFIPSHVDIQVVISDMQGMDFASISVLPKSQLSRIGFLVTECNCAEKRSYHGLQNSLDSDWWPFMKRMGVFQLHPHALLEDDTPVAFCKEYGETDLVWRNRNRPRNFTMDTVPLLKKGEIVDLRGAFAGLPRLVDPGSPLFIAPWKLPKPAPTGSARN